MPTEVQTAYNTEMTTCRIAVKNEFAYVTNLWIYNDFFYQLRIGLSSISAYYEVSAVLCNAISCLVLNQISTHFKCSLPLLEEYLRRYI